MKKNGGKSAKKSLIHNAGQGTGTDQSSLSGKFSPSSPFGKLLPAPAIIDAAPAIKSPHQC